MRKVTSTLTERGRTTIPAAVRNALSLKPRQWLIYEIREEYVLIRPDRDDPIDLAGCLKSEITAGTKEEERDKARAARLRSHL
jgi:bifunctional DNA-binding transcriptional regulator/antitoxin component of YhaV-PrlF toxin-antitoxin module